MPNIPDDAPGPSGMTALQHERLVASQAPNSRYSGHVIKCEECGGWFRTTDWPPAVCREWNECTALRTALMAIAQPWQANYERLRAYANAALNPPDAKEAEHRCPDCGFGMYKRRHSDLWACANCGHGAGAEETNDDAR